tara:strand:+ start:245 stop:568 length:324 start_codon:yes stop_codon:yes gene_type:complete
MFNKGANMSKLIKQAQKMKDDMDRAQNELKDMRIEVVSNDKMIELVLDGNKNVISLSIDESLLSEEKDFIEDVFISALNKANTETDSQVKDKMSKVTGGMMPNLPGF